MPNLPYKFTVTPVTPLKFQELESAVRDNGGTVTIKSATTGIVHTNDIDFEFDFDPDNVNLSINVTSANDFLARHVSNETIEKHVRDLIAKQV